VWDFDLLSTAVPSAKSPSPSPSPAPTRSPSATAPLDDDPLFDLGFGTAPTPAAAPPHDEFDLLDAFAAPASARPSPAPSPSPAPDAPRRSSPVPAPAASLPAAAPADPPPHILGHLVEMGFAPRAAAAALVASRTTTAAAGDGGWDLERALEVLVQGQGQAGSGSGSRDRERDEWGDEGDVRVGRRRSWEREDDEEEARAQAQAQAQAQERRRREEQQRRRRAGAAAEDAPAAPRGSTRARARPDGPTPQPPQQQQPPQALDAARVLQDQAGDMLLSAQKLGFSMFKSANALLGEGKKALARRIEEQRAAAAAVAGAGAGAASGRERGREGAGAREGRAGEGGQQFPGRPRWWTEEMEREEQEDQRRAASAPGEGRAPQSGFRDDDDEVVPARPFADPPRARCAEPQPAAAPPPAAEYRSPFRRAKAPAVAVAEADLLSGAAAPPPRSTPSPSLAPTSSTRGAAPPSRASPSPTPSSRAGTPTPARSPRRAPSTRPHLPVSPSSLATATSHKSTGNAHFKLGRFGDATAAYSLALDALPAQWLGRVPLLNNRAQARLRSGEEKGAAEDCAEAVRILLPGSGGGEVDLDLAALEADGPALAPEVAALYAPSGGAAPLDLKDQLGKALGRRAKALEALEKWGAARDDWERVLRCGDEAVLRGAGGAKMVGEGVARCRKVLDPPAAAAASGAGPSSSSAGRPAAARPAAAAASSSRPKPRPAVQGSGEAVRALQAQQAAAAAEDDARHALKDVVDARIAAWKGGKEANLRALIASLDKVLWPELGWKTVGMHELISEGQLKVRYVRAIAKLHPDKVRRSSSLSRSLPLTDLKGVGADDEMHLRAAQCRQHDRRAAHGRRARLCRPQRRVERHEVSRAGAYRAWQRFFDQRVRSAESSRACSFLGSSGSARCRDLLPRFLFRLSLTLVLSCTAPGSTSESESKLERASAGPSQVERTNPFSLLVVLDQRLPVNRRAHLDVVLERVAIEPVGEPRVLAAQLGVVVLAAVARAGQCCRAHVGARRRRQRRDADHDEGARAAVGRESGGRALCRDDDLGRDRDRVCARDGRDEVVAAAPAACTLKRQCRFERAAEGESERGDAPPARLRDQVRALLVDVLRAVDERPRPPGRLVPSDALDVGSDGNCLLRREGRVGLGEAGVAKQGVRVGEKRGGAVQRSGEIGRRV